MLARSQLRGRRPAFGGVTLIAMIAQSRAVQVRMTRRAIVGGLLEDWIDVALLARHIGVHPVEAKRRLGVVMKLGMLPDGRPCR
jgi:hypothetical protein